MVRRYNRLLVAFYVITDALLAMWAFLLAYAIRFESGLIPVTRGYPPIENYLNILPFVAVLTPLAFQLQGVYRLRRGRSRVDDFFAVLIGSILAVMFGLWSTLYVQTYYVSENAKSAGAYEVSQLVWALFLGGTVVFTYASREGMRVGAAKQGSFGSIGSNQIEGSNVDLASEFSDLIVAQRGYQASSRIVSTANELLQELFDMKGHR